MFLPSRGLCRKSRSYVAQKEIRLIIINSYSMGRIAVAGSDSDVWRLVNIMESAKRSKDFSGALKRVTRGGSQGLRWCTRRCSERGLRITIATNDELNQSRGKGKGKGTGGTKMEKLEADRCLFEFWLVWHWHGHCPLSTRYR